MKNNFSSFVVVVCVLLSPAPFAHAQIIVDLPNPNDNGSTSTPIPSPSPLPLPSPSPTPNRPPPELPPTPKPTLPPRPTPPPVSSPPVRPMPTRSPVIVEPETTSSYVSISGMSRVSGGMLYRLTPARATSLDRVRISVVAANLHVIQGWYTTVDGQRYSINTFEDQILAAGDSVESDYLGSSRIQSIEFVAEAYGARASINFEFEASNSQMPKLTVDRISLNSVPPAVEPHVEPPVVNPPTSTGTASGVLGVGDRVYVNGYSSYSQITRDLNNGTFEVVNSGTGTRIILPGGSLGVTRGCVRNSCVGARVYVNGYSSYSVVAAIFDNEMLYVQNSGTGTFIQIAAYSVARDNACEGRRQICPAHRVYVNGYSSYSTVVGVFGNGMLYVQNAGTGTFLQINPDNVAMTANDGRGLSIGERVYINGYSSYSTVVGKFLNASVYVQNAGTGSFIQIAEHSTAVTRGCLNGGPLCIGSRVLVSGYSSYSVVVGIFGDGSVYLQNTGTGSFVNVKPNSLRLF